MATLLELNSLFTDSDLHDKVKSALIVSVQNTLSGTPTADQQKYAAKVWSDPSSEAKKALFSVLATNSGASVAAIKGATDASIQANVDDVIGTLITAFISGV